MRITTRLIPAFLAVSILPLIMVSYIEWRALDRVSSLAIEESTEALKRLGEASIRQKALSVARQVELYLEAHPDLLTLPPEALQADEALAAIAFQDVGQTGYTCLYEAGTGIMRIHPNSALIDRDMSFLADELPSWWAIFEPSLSGTEVSGYYDWLEADGSVRQKYMTMTPVGVEFHEITLMIAATTYIDEFYQSVRDTEARITGISQETQLQMRVAMFVVGLMAVLTAIFLATITIRPLRRIAEGVRLFSQGELDHEITVGTRDEIGQLATTFNQMMKSIQQAQGALRESEERYRSLFDSVLVGLYRTTPAGQILDANPALVEMLGYPDRQFLLAANTASIRARSETFAQRRSNVWPKSHCI